MFHAIDRIFLWEGWYVLFCLHSRQSFEIFFTFYCYFLLGAKIKRYQIMSLLRYGTLTKTAIQLSLRFQNFGVNLAKKTHITAPLIRKFYRNGASSKMFFKNSKKNWIVHFFSNQILFHEIQADVLWNTKWNDRRRCYLCWTAETHYYKKKLSQRQLNLLKKARKNPKCVATITIYYNCKCSIGWC